MWAVLIVTLPTQSNAVRLRIWRAHGGTASVLALSQRDAVQRAEVLARFDRTEAYVLWRQTAVALQRQLGHLGKTEVRRRLRSVAEALKALRRTDCYPGPAAEQAAADLPALPGACDARFDKGEPRSRPGDAIAPLDSAMFHGRGCATRARHGVGRLPSAWLIRRFIDPQAEFVWLPEQAAPVRAPRGALGFDFDGARFSPVGARVTFEVLMAHFGLDSDTRLRRIASAVHYLDIGGIPVPEAAGLGGVMAGLRELHRNDDKLLGAATAMFNALYAAPGAAP